jgi:superfamily II DNA/RNA helicase
MVPASLDAQIPSEWQDIVSTVLDGQALRPLQKLAFQQGVLASRRHLIIAAPTNSGKSAVGLIGLLQAVRGRRRAILIEPLRALAREKADDLERISPQLKKAIGRPFKMRVTTGDYRLDDEAFADPAPNGELIIATPERLEAILRNPEHAAWLGTVGAVCVDEAHLIASPRRGPTLEYLITAFLCLPAPPRLFLLSATLGNLDAAKEWLAPCDVVEISERYPPLEKKVVEVPEGQDAGTAISDWLKMALKDPTAQALVFVYQTRSAEKLARELTQSLAALVGPAGAKAYHSQMSAGQREQVRTAFLAGRSRVVVTTSALAMGVNLPATHVAVRDLSYPGADSPELGDLLQMMGRAGRGDQAGVAAVFKQARDAWDTAALRKALAEEHLPDFQSAFASDQSQRRRDSNAEPPAIPQVLAFLSRRGKTACTQEDIEQFFLRSFGGQHLAGLVGGALFWLETKKLAFRSEQGAYALTNLGSKVALSVLPPPLAAGYAQLLRDLLQGDNDDTTVGGWKALDHLLVLCLLYDRTPGLRPYSEALVTQVNGWAERNAQIAPLLFQRWMRGEKKHSSSHEILGSLGVRLEGKSLEARHEAARRHGYRAMFQAIVLNERAMGMSAEQIERQYGISNLEGIEERWRDDVLWLLSGIAGMLDVKCFYYHLKETCEAPPERIKRVKRLVGRMRRQTYELREQIKYCSALGPLLGPLGGVGVQSIRQLEAAGVSGFAQLQKLGVDGLIANGIRRDIARRIGMFLRRRPF